MGEMADMIIEQALSYDMDPDEPDAPALITCRYCRTPDLEWGNVDGKWRLHTSNGKMHMCKVKPLPEPPKPRIITDPVEKAFRAGYHMGYEAAMAEAYPDVGPDFSANSDPYTEYTKKL